MTASRRSALLRSDARWGLNKQDLVFLIWGMIWITWLSVFVALYSWAWFLTAVTVGASSFLVLWWAFCRSLDLMTKRS